MSLHCSLSYFRTFERRSNDRMFIFITKKSFTSLLTFKMEPTENVSSVSSAMSHSSTTNENAPAIIKKRGKFFLNTWPKGSLGYHRFLGLYIIYC